MSATLLPPATAHAHRDPDILRWLAAYTSSMLGDSVYYLALSWAAVQAGTPAQAGLVMSAGALPRAVLMLGGGVIADRFGPRRVVIGSDAVRCAAVLAVAALLFLAGPGLWPLALLALVFGTVDAVFMPAVGALPARLAEKGQLARVQGMRGLAIRFAGVVGAPLGGLGVAVGGASAAFALAGLLIAVSVPLLLSVRVRDLPKDDTPGSAGTAWSDLGAGLHHIRRHHVLAPLMLAIALGDLGFVGPLNVGLTLLADRRGWGASGMGWVLAGFGAGAAAASLLLAVRGRVPRAGLVTGCACTTGAVAIGALAYVPSLVGAVAVALLIGLLAGLSGALCGALLQTQSDPAFLGRVTAVSSLVSLGLAPLSMPVAAAATGAFGLGPVYVVSAVVCGLGGLVALAVPGLRRAELPR
ncbi:putative MFS family arabinose efflux permease [Streptomyces griseochromogenes]|uniref:MFS family arabinose efflux permease n=1 Tax=Streptomyces griseochromogenes TaxID=68214 RepID=A0A1B1B6Q8_9ACTN|nr:MFS transporter [Streptomyces griseochromogenes]ANP54479.1 MFS transporter [Streptomyces griseochromogenes]MBP2049000.1 putative MFS family arabinose efflux permease [Streptomyces griseochromogenes]